MGNSVLVSKNLTFHARKFDLRCPKTGVIQRNVFSINENSVCNNGNLICGNGNSVATREDFEIQFSLSENAFSSAEI